MERARRTDMAVVALTGGPCAGKTTFLGYALPRLERAGYRAYVVPEVATEMYESGARISEGLDHDMFEALAARRQAFSEDFYADVASASADGRPAVVICDRGLPDARAYVSDTAVFDEVLEGLGIGRETVMSRYDFVLHLRTVAYGSEGAYSLDNPARIEQTPQAARDADDMTLAQWSGHPKLAVIENGEGVQAKMESAWRSLEEFLDGFFPARRDASD